MGRRLWIILIITAAVGAGIIVMFMEGKFRSPVVSPLGTIVEKPFEKYTIENLRQRTFVPTPIIFDEATSTTSAYTVYTFHYISDGLKVTGVAHVPNDALRNPPAGGKKPVIIQFRGYVDQTHYVPGEGTAHSAEVFAQNGFISLAPDFLGYGGSDAPSKNVFEERFQTYTTALNLIASVGSVPFADADKIGIWGHSNGGQIALTVLEILGKPVPAVLWAPVSKPFPYSILYYTDDIPDHGKLLRKELAKFENDYDVENYSLTNYFARIRGPLQIQQGSADTEVPQAWSDTLVKALEASSSATINYFVYPAADHNMTGPPAGGWDTVVARDVAFFNKCLK